MELATVFFNVYKGTFINIVARVVLKAHTHFGEANMRHPLTVETPIHDSIRESITWECKEHGVKS
jgi:hypothetical protein